MPGRQESISLNRELAHLGQLVNLLSLVPDNVTSRISLVEGQFWDFSLVLFHILMPVFEEPFGCALDSPEPPRHFFKVSSWPAEGLEGGGSW